MVSLIYKIKHSDDECYYLMDFFSHVVTNKGMIVNVTKRTVTNIKAFSGEFAAVNFDFDFKITEDILEQIKKIRLMEAL